MPRKNKLLYTLVSLIYVNQFMIAERRVMLIP
jgi:hypothetical protein